MKFSGGMFKCWYLLSTDLRSDGTTQDRLRAKRNVFRFCQLRGEKCQICSSHSGAMARLNEVKKSLISRGQATELFAQLREDGLASLLGNLEQTVFGEPACLSVESKGRTPTVFRDQ